MRAWVWPRLLALMISVLLLTSAWVQPAARWDDWLQAQAPLVAERAGWTLARPALIGSALFLHSVPHAGWIHPGRTLQAMPVLVQIWALWPARAAVHAAVLALWLGLCSPGLWVYARHRRGDAARALSAGAVAAPLGALMAWPVWRRGLGTLPLGTLLWSVTAPATVGLAPGLACLWLIAAGALWWPAATDRLAEG